MNKLIQSKLCDNETIVQTTTMNPTIQLFFEHTNCGHKSYLIAYTTKIQHHELLFQREG